MRLYDYAASGNCFKVRLLLRMLDRSDVELVPTDIFAGATLRDAYAAINPVREVPVLEVDDGRRLTESSAILWYLAEGTDWLPADAFGRACVVKWCSFEQERVMVGIGGARFRKVTGRPGWEDRLPTGAQALAVLDAHLREHDWLVGDRATIADLAVYAYGQFAEEMGLDVAAAPGFRAWLDRVRALPRFADDLAPYPESARPGVGASVYG
jgi:glutathione S-transferase